MRISTVSLVLSIHLRGFSLPLFVMYQFGLSPVRRKSERFERFSLTQFSRDLWNWNYFKRGGEQQRGGRSKKNVENVERIGRMFSILIFRHSFTSVTNCLGENNVKMMFVANNYFFMIINYERKLERILLNFGAIHWLLLWKIAFKTFTQKWIFNF